MKKQKKEVSFQFSYARAFSFLRVSRFFIYSIILIFVLALALGYIFPHVFEEELLRFLEELIQQTEGFSLWQMILFLFVNNAQSAFFGIFLGILLGLFPVFHALFNGYVLGFVANRAIALDGVFSLWRVLPHGIFELPAIFISLGVGMKLGSFIFEKKKIVSLRDFLFSALCVFALIILPLLAIAAIIEGSLIVLLR